MPSVRFFSGRDLQVFTSGSEYMVSGTPLTPSSIQLNRQTRIGSMTTRQIPPLDVDGATLFIARSGTPKCASLSIRIPRRHILPNDLSLLSSHLLVNPVEMDFDISRRLLFVVRADGSFLTLTLYSAEDVLAWTRHSTAGAVQSVCVVGDVTYILVQRNGVYFIEQFDDTLALDACLSGTASTPAAVWSGLGYLNGQSVSIVADQAVRPNATVSGGAVTIDPPASSVQIGLTYTHTVQPLPPNAAGSDGSGIRARLIDLTLRLENTSALTLDTGMGLNEIPLRTTTDAIALDAPPPQITGDITVKGLGWQRDLSQPLWEIVQDTPLPFTLLSIAALTSVQ